MLYNERKVLGALSYHPTPDRLNLGYWRGEFGHLRGWGGLEVDRPQNFFEIRQSKVKLIGPGFFEIRPRREMYNSETGYCPAPNICSKWAKKFPIG